MNRNVVLTSILSLATFVLSAILAFVYGRSQFLLHFVNIMFYIALLLVIIGGFLFIFERGGYNVVRYAFHKARFFIKPKEEAMIAEVEGEKNEKGMLYQTYSFTFTYPILLTGIFSALLSTIISFMFLV